MRNHLALLLMIISISFMACQSIPNASSPLNIVPGEMVTIEGGTFKMGDSKYGPIHEIHINKFLIGRFLVTVNEFSKFIIDTNYVTTAELLGNAYGIYDGKWGFQNGFSWKNPGFKQTDIDPVVGISWFDAIAYLNWLSQREGLEPVYSCSGIVNIKYFPAGWNQTQDTPIEMDMNATGYRLPTEAEWEFVARDGEDGKNYQFSGSNKIQEVAWYWDNSKMRTHPIGDKKPNGLGIYDMSGNAYQWCWDWYSEEYYSISPIDNPLGPISGSLKSIRGGSWRHFMDNASVYFRSNEGNPLAHDTGFGFRLAQTIK